MQNQSKSFSQKNQKKIFKIRHGKNDKIQNFLLLYKTQLKQNPCFTN